MRIAVRLEGGLGDHLLANRFVGAIRDKYPVADIHAFSDKERSLKFLQKMWPQFYNEVEVIPSNPPNYEIETRFGRENYPAHIANVSHEQVTKWFGLYDKFYNLHIDSLNWLNHDYDWQRYFYFFPRPQAKVDDTPAYNGEKYILAHLYARPDSPYNLEQWYVISLIKKLCKKHTVVILTLPEHEEYYKELIGQNVYVDKSQSLEQLFYLAKHCKAFIGVDSGVRYIPYHFSKPTFVFSKDCQEYGRPNKSHLIRWLIFPWHVFPMHFDTHVVSTVIENAIDNPACSLYPEVFQNIDAAIVNRFA